MASLKTNKTMTQSGSDVEDYQDILSESAANVISEVLIGSIETLSVFGICINVINLMIFYQQGFKSATNIALFALSFADMFNLVIVEVGLLFYNPFIIRSFPYPVDCTELANLAATPHPALARVRSWIYVFLTAERCLCIFVPLTVKRLVTPTRAGAVMVAIYVLNVSVAVPFWLDMYVDWKYYPNLNQTMLGVMFRYDRTYIRGPVHVTFAVIMFTTFPLVVLFTAVLIWKLQRMSLWRKESTAADRSDFLAKRDRTVIKMVVVIALVLIISLSPSVVFFVWTSLALYYETGQHHQSVTLFSWFAYLLDVENSCVNIIIYFNMSSNFRQTFIKTFWLSRAKQQIDQ
ncbi:allatostatin-A receptor [Biomphalaria glabrata]|nr:allatostatin-A receptor [Biomphalaria glabrata]